MAGGIDLTFSGSFSIFIMARNVGSSFTLLVSIMAESYFVPLDFSSMQNHTRLALLENAHHA